MDLVYEAVITRVVLGANKENEYKGHGAVLLGFQEY